jgi:hypothetical protein
MKDVVRVLFLACAALTAGPGPAGTAAPPNTAPYSKPLRGRESGQNGAG